MWAEHFTAAAAGTPPPTGATVVDSWSRRVATWRRTGEIVHFCGVAGEVCVEPEGAGVGACVCVGGGEGDDDVVVGDGGGVATVVVVPGGGDGGGDPPSGAWPKSCTQ